MSLFSTDRLRRIAKVIVFGIGGEGVEGRRLAARRSAMVRGPRTLQIGRTAALAFALCSAAAAQEPEADTADPHAPELYQAQAFVTGEGEENRPLGFQRCLEDVLVKVTGDPTIVTDQRVGELAGRADTLIAEFHYRDRMEGIPLHDEQGTRERPYELTCIFDPAKLDAAIRSLGRAPWTEARPRILVLLGARNGTAAYILSEDGEQGRTMREAFASASARTGMPIDLPSEKELADAGLSFASLPATTLAELEPVTNGDAELVLAGSMVFNEEALGWVAGWRLALEGKTYRWQVRGVGFDEAFRAGLRGAAQILSGNGAPG